MEVSVFGKKFDLLIVVVSMLIGLLIGATTLCSCCGSFNKKKEGLANLGAPLNYQLGNGVPGDTWTASHTKTQNAEKSMYSSLMGNTGGPVPLPDGQLYMFAQNKFRPECCNTPQQYASSTGCACISPEQMKFLNSRGGNNNLPKRCN